MMISQQVLVKCPKLRIDGKEDFMKKTGLVWDHLFVEQIASKKGASFITMDADTCMRSLEV